IPAERAGRKLLDRDLHRHAVDRDLDGLGARAELRTADRAGRLLGHVSLPRAGRDPRRRHLTAAAPRGKGTSSRSRRAGIGRALFSRILAAAAGSSIMIRAFPRSGAFSAMLPPRLPLHFFKPGYP